MGNMYDGHEDDWGYEEEQDDDNQTNNSDGLDHSYCGHGIETYTCNVCRD